MKTFKNIIDIIGCLAIGVWACCVINEGDEVEG